MKKQQYTRKEVELIFKDFEVMLRELDKRIFGTGHIPNYFYLIKEKYLGKENIIRKIIIKVKLS